MKALRYTGILVMESAQKPDFAVEWWPISRPKPYPKNARKWSAKAVDKVAASIRELPAVDDGEDIRMTSEHI